MTYPPWAWAVFGAALLVLLGIDIVSHRSVAHETRRGAILWSAIWISVGLAFNAFIWLCFGAEPASEYLAAYLIEKSLSIDNIFVFLVIFQSLNIHRDHQRVALSWGTFGALAFRAAFIFLGAAALERYRWVSYLFGALLLYAAWRVLREDPAEEKESGIVKWLSKHLPVTHAQHGKHFFVHENGRRVATPLIVAVIGLELTDILFAVDSVPAALSVTSDRFIVYSSNAFAILGLRSLYMLLAHTIADLKYLHYGLAVVLAFAAFKLITSRLFHIPALLSVAIIAAVIGAAVIASLRARRRGQDDGEDHGQRTHHRAPLHHH